MFPLLSIPLVLFFALRLLPERFQLFHSRLIGGAAGFAEVIFHPLKAALELAVGFLKSAFRIEREIASDVNQDEEHIADFVLEARVKFRRNLRLS